MFSRCHSGNANRLLTRAARTGGGAKLLWPFLLAASLAFAADGRVLRVCSDPDNLPFSNQRGEGFENKLAELVAQELGAKLEYTWWPEKLGFVRKSLNAGLCDVVMGVPSTIANAAATKPYYRSTYVFVSRGQGIASLDDERLSKMKIGIPMVGDDYAPPSHALARRGLSANVVGFRGDDNRAITDAVATGKVDVAVMWGPFAGWYAKGLDVRPVEPAAYLGVPFTFAISMAVRKQNAPLRIELDRVIAARCGAIQKLLDEYRVPGEGRNTCESSPESPSVLR
jgi:quinoprotein dehydrogenase-associated probable ABC transporter substrate-binding protein